MQDEAINHLAARKKSDSIDNVRERIHQLSQKVHTDPDNPSWPQQIADLYAQLEEYDNAIRWYEYSSCTTKQNDESAQKRVQEIRGKKLDKEIQFYQEAAKDDPITYQKHINTLLAKRKALE